jgi:NitT/TauT family transport system substrate-binding protein
MLTLSRSHSFNLVLLLLCCAVMGCSALAPTPTPVASTPVRVQLAWIHEYSSSGFYAAELNKHFAEQNLQVSLQAGGFVDGRYVEPIDQVVNGEFDFGTTAASSLLEARANGKPVVAIAALFQRSPSAIISLAETNIKQPRDLVGKTIAVAEGGATNLLKIMLISQGIELSQVNIIPREGFGVEPLLNGNVDALLGWIINEGVQVRELGEEPSFMLMSDYGIPDYNTLVFTTEDTISKRPELVERFLKAFLEGLHDTIENPQQAAEYTLQYNSELDLTGQLDRIQTSIPLIEPARTRAGMMEAETWQAIYDILTEAEILTTAVDIESVYTTTFLEKIYGA